MEIKELLNQYRIEASKHGECTETGDYKNGNKAYKKLQNILQKITDMKAEERLLDLFNDSNKWVQLWSATHFLKSNEKQALKKLEELQKENIPHISTSAKYTIMEHNG